MFSSKPDNSGSPTTAKSPPPAWPATDCEISVVIPTFNRREDLRRMLNSLWAQTLSRTRFEVIVACDGSTDGTIEMVQEFQARPWNLTLLQLVNRGPAAARNAGARAARSRYIAFTDDDCIAAPDWLEQIQQAFRSTGTVAIQGRTTTNRAARTPLTHEIEVLRAWTSTMPTCNAAYAKSEFEAVGCFDESFPFAHNEDTDLAWRIEDVGKVVFAPEVHIIHPPRRDTFAKQARSVRIFQSDFLLFYKNPIKYRRYIGPSPWWTIYWKVFVVGQFHSAKFSCKYLFKPFRPDYFVVAMGLLLARWFNLIRFFPDYCKAQNSYRLEVALNSSSLAKSAIEVADGLEHDSSVTAVKK